MRIGTKVGLLMVAASIILSIWVIAGQSSRASKVIDGGFQVSDDGTTLEKLEPGVGGTINVPEGITSIAAGAFGSNTAITQVTLPSTVTNIGKGAFMGCTNLSSISIAPSGNSYAIPADAFNGCSSLSSVDLPNNISGIGSQAFYGCVALTHITIPSGVTRIETDAFRECKNLTNYSVASGNSAYSEAGGCIYNSSKTRLLMVPEGKTAVSIAPGTQTIASYAMQYCTALSTVTIPNSVSVIEADAFKGSGIQSITIPATVTSIGAQSEWTPKVIYGADHSAAMEFAQRYHYPFVVIGENGSGSGVPGDSTDPGTTNPGTSDPGTTDPGNNGNPTDGMTDMGDGTFADADGNLFYADGTPVNPTTNGQGSGNGTHTLDNTPTTADGIDPRYFLCLAVFASGVGVILYSRFNKMQYVSNNKKH